MANVVAMVSFVYKKNGVDTLYRQDSTTVADTDPAYVAHPELFTAAGGAKTASASFVYRDSAAGIDRFVRKGKTKVASSHSAFVAAPGLFT